MQWLILLAAAFVFVILGKYVKPFDEVYAITAHSTGILSAFWGFVIAPTSTQIILAALVFGWLQVISFRF